ncbi:putative N-acetylmuramoyl-L-alanine amidase [Paenibacillus mucilaginosus 3016]|uniref:N-acetylmuramoyl-L-alanine amidase n=2 Tax=Paenibacillus mucilaginosus TaxID=61624 RepID=I0BRS2_9BACL|nr:N-acetylmuramoyl-L-alanine amidase [Paenibacillus mucilaginosus]AFC32738.1 putative N-acetylmuramoyl-L-alanine amidase [Paenibacillus mucilaginosus 3016]AFH65069.1 N-acetylmuramoyl-L-alanine amidase [Paenibacillus mucilaginosus K02]WFA21201.1 N-acetylmuramoyl-L-alanine amidase [Paenibacillus mucilaginosus]
MKPRTPVRQRIGSLLLAGLAAGILPGFEPADMPESPPWPMVDQLLLPEIRADHPALSQTDILIDVGHGGVDGGTVYGDILEKNINLEIARRTYDALRGSGYTVLLNRVGDYALSSDNHWLNSRSRHLKDLAQRSHLAKEVSPKVMISLHVNSAKNSSKRGALLIHQKGKESRKLALCLQEALNPLYGTDTEPVYGRSYYLMKHVKAPSVIVEMGYLTNEEDRRLLLDAASQQKIAERIAAGVRTYLDVHAR